MILHVLPGDAYLETFRETGLEGEVAVCRESLIEGPLDFKSLQEFWKAREQFLTQTYPNSPNVYATDVVAEFEKMIGIPEGSEINLWFENELFCQVNMWFCLDLLRNSKTEVYRVGPVVRSGDGVWNGFGELIVDEFETCFQARHVFSPDDILLGSNLWSAYRTGDKAQLRILSESDSPCFSHLKEACEAAIEIDTRPKKILEEITKDGEKNFDKIFAAFSRKAGIYGFGDLQVKRIVQSY